MGMRAISVTVLSLTSLSLLINPSKGFAVSSWKTPFALRPRSVTPLPTARTPGVHNLRMPREGASKLGMQFGGLANLLRGGGGGGSSGSGNKDDPDAPLTDKAPSWTDLKTMLEKQQTQEERDFRSQLASGRSKTHSLATLRMFDAPDGTEPRVTLYRDVAAWCPYCEKVWLQLEEKRIPYKVEKVNMRCYGDKPDWFMRMQPSGGIPVAKIDGRVITESNDIMQALEDTFPDHNPLTPDASDPQAPRVRGLLRLEREIFSAWFRWLVSSTRAGDAQQKNFEGLMDRVDAELAQSHDIATANGAKEGRLFLGDKLSIVDCMFAPFLERMVASVPYFKGLLIRNNPRWPHVTMWFEAMEQREAFSGIESDYYTHVHNLAPQIGTCWSHKEAKAYADEIDGRGDAWKLPLKEGIEPVQISDEAAARREAAERVIANHEAIVKFALRAVGQKGFPGVSSPLADPNAVPDLRFTPQVDAAMRHVVASLLQGGQGELELSEGLPRYTVQECLQYFNERISVPRDMSWSARRQLCAHANRISDALS
uniref:GST N-terminal domain-containing protein n=1 Tax=Hemiselmis andersenii TaxID=464988 RepID=A0A6U2EXV2_HEMAN